LKLLLDTHSLIWYALDDPRLSATARGLIEDPSSEVLVSPASLWEIAIKVSNGKLALHQPYKDFLGQFLRPGGFRALPIESDHLIHLASLPFPPGHKDPFDRLLIAQAIVEGVAIVGADWAFDGYLVHRIW